MPHELLTFSVFFRLPSTFAQADFSWFLCFAVAGLVERLLNLHHHLLALRISQMLSLSTEPVRAPRNFPSNYQPGA